MKRWQEITASINHRINMQIKMEIMLNQIMLSLIMERRWKIKNVSKLVLVNLRGLKNKRIHLKILRNININMCFRIRNQ